MERGKAAQKAVQLKGAGQQGVQRSSPPYRQSLEGKQSMNSDRGDSLSPTPAMMTCRVPHTGKHEGLADRYGPHSEMTDINIGPVPF